AVEVAIGAFRQAEWPVDIDPEPGVGFGRATLQPRGARKVGLNHRPVMPTNGDSRQPDPAPSPCRIRPKAPTAAERGEHSEGLYFQSRGDIASDVAKVDGGVRERFRDGARSRH